MPFAPFHEYVPEIGIAETRSIRVPPQTGSPLPADEYGFLELYCNEPGCDCRRVMFRVLSEKRCRDEAIITWGWETPQFYEKWLRRADPETVGGLIGPCLNIGSPASAIAAALVEVTSQTLLRDRAYTDRIKRHYNMFRKRIGDHR